MTLVIDPEKSRIVVADDDIENAKTIESALRSDGYQVRAVHDGESALQLVRSWSPHVVLLDINMPKMTGAEALGKIRSLSGGEYVGVLFVTANATLDEVVMGLDSGADDYIIKPYRLNELKARLRACLRTKNLHDALRRANKRLEDAADLDDLTGLFNMRFLSRKLGEEVELAKRTHRPISCIMFDMDNFKGVNDKHDHLFGSEVLREVACVIRPLLRSTDLPGRYGGDEYFILLPDTKLKEAFELAEKLRKRIEEHQFRSGTASARLTASFGVSGADSAETVTVLDSRELMRSADAALYRAKGRGRNCTDSSQV